MRFQLHWRIIYSGRRGSEPHWKTFDRRVWKARIYSVTLTRSGGGYVAQMSVPSRRTLDGNRAVLWEETSFAVDWKRVVRRAKAFAQGLYTETESNSAFERSVSKLPQKRFDRLVERGAFGPEQKPKLAEPST